MTDPDDATPTPSVSERPLDDGPPDVEPERSAPGPGLLDLVRRAAAHPDAPIRVLTALVVVWIVVMARLILTRQHNMETFDFDEGIYGQFLWQLGHFRTFNTIRGVSLQGHHASFAFILFMPLVWLGGDVGTWDVVQTIAVACTAYPLYFLARDRVRRPWVACAVGAVWLGQPTVQWWIHEGFHPEVMAIPFIVGTFLYGERMIAERAAGEISRRSRWGFIACFLMTITWKEDLALALAGMGLVWVLRRQWWLAKWVIGVAAAWFVVFGIYLVPHFAGGSVFGGTYDLGTTPGMIVKNAVMHPSRVAHKLNQNDAVGYGRDLSEPFGFVALLSPSTLLIGFPQWFTNIISASAFTWALDNHYQAVPLASLAISLVEGLRRAYRRRLWLGQVAVVAALGLSLAYTTWYGPTPLSHKYRYSWPAPGPDIAVKRAALARIPGGAGVSADYLLVPQLTRRQHIYKFPNPWRNAYYGTSFTAVGNPAKVTWVVVATPLLDDRDKGLLQSIAASGEFTVVINQQGVVLLHRIRAPGHGTAKIVDPPQN